jgi:hypothetical protein
MGMILQAFKHLAEPAWNLSNVIPGRVKDVEPGILEIPGSTLRVAPE